MRMPPTSNRRWAHSDQRDGSRGRGSTTAPANTGGGGGGGGGNPDPAHEDELADGALELSLFADLPLSVQLSSLTARKAMFIDATSRARPGGMSGATGC